MDLENFKKADKLQGEIKQLTSFKAVFTEHKWVRIEP